MEWKKVMWEGRLHWSSSSLEWQYKLNNQNRFLLILPSFNFLQHTPLMRVGCRLVCYEELGGNYFDEHDRQATEKRLVQRLEKLGYHVELQEVAQVA